MIITEKTDRGVEQYDLPSRLLQDRIITVSGEVEGNMCMSVAQQLLYLDSLSDDPIFMYINSPGGSVSDGLMVVDTMNYIKSPVYTIVLGLAASMGTIIASSGDKGHRYMLPHAEYLIHQPMGGAGGHTQQTDMAIIAEHLSTTRTTLNNILADASGKPLETIKQDTERDNWMSAEEALEYGFIDKIITSTKDIN